MKRIVTIVIILFCCYPTCFSQEPKWTFEECVEYALEHNLDIRSKRIEIKGAKLNVKTSQQSRLPNLGFGTTQNFQFGRTLTKENTYEDNNQANTGITFESEVPLFAGFQIKNQIEIDRLNLDISLSSLEKAEKDVTLQIALQFLQILLEKELGEINRKQIELIKEQLVNTENLANLGRIPQSYIYDVKAQLASDEYTLIQSSVNEKKSLLYLSQLLDLRDFQEFDIKVPLLNDIESSLLLLPSVDSIYSSALAFFPEIKIANQALEAGKKQLLLSKSAYYPSIAMYANYNNGYYHIYKAEN